MLVVKLIRQHFEVEVSIDELLQLTSINGGDLQQVAALVQRARAGEVQGKFAKPVTMADLQAECALPSLLIEADLNKLPRAEEAMYSILTVPTIAIFLTGATGFLGAAVLSQLAERHAGQHWTCKCLVRDTTDQVMEILIFKSPKQILLLT